MTFSPTETIPKPFEMRVSKFLSEWRVLPTILRSCAKLTFSPIAQTVKKGSTSNELVLLVPGFGVGERTLEPLRRYLQNRGILAEHWGLGVNSGDPERDSQRLITRIEQIENHNYSVSLIGWSLGGVIAREVARTRPDLVKKVFTLCTPVIGGPTYTLAAGYWGKQACQDIAEKVRTLDENTPIKQPVVAFFTKNDGVVSWPACIDQYSDEVTHYEVNSSHSAIGFNWHVWEKIYEMM